MGSPGFSRAVGGEADARDEWRRYTDRRALSPIEWIPRRWERQGEKRTLPAASAGVSGVDRVAADACCQ